MPTNPFMQALATVLETVGGDQASVREAVTRLRADTPAPAPVPGPTPPAPSPVNPVPPAPSPVPPIPNPGIITVVNEPPGSKHNMEGWKLTLSTPYGGVTDKAPEVFWTKGLETLRVPGSFEMLSNSAVRFRSSVKGLRTSAGTKYCRVEFREVTKGPSPRSQNWKCGVGTHRLPGDFFVEEYPKVINPAETSKLVVGQIHGPNDELCRITAVDGHPMYFVDDKAGPEMKETKFFFKAPDGSQLIAKPGMWIKFLIDVSPTVQTVSVMDEAGKIYTAVDPLSPFWLAGPPVYFKKGNYLQVHGLEGVTDGTEGTGFGSLLMRDLSAPLHSGDTVFITS